MRRGQISLFLIVAAVLVIVVFLGLRLVAQLAPDTTADTFPVDGRDANTTLCLRDATTVAIMDVMRDGGFNLEPLNPTDHAYEDIPGQGRIHVGVNRLLTPALYMPGPPFTPDPTNPQFGRVTFEPLCARRGTNAPNADMNGANTCLRGTYYIAGPTLSIQQRLEARITALITDPATEGCPPVTSPLTLTLGASDVTATVGNESVRVPIRLKAMYNAARTFALLEVTDPDFLLTPTSTSFTRSLPCEDTVNFGECMLQGLSFTTEQISDPCEGNDGTDCAVLPPNWNVYTTIVTLTDSTVRIDGKNPEFRFLVRNRYPLVAALHAPPAPVQVFTADCSGVPTAALPIELGVDVDDTKLLAYITSSVPNAVDDINTPAPLLCASGVCTVTVSCGAWQGDFVDNNPIDFTAVLCSEPVALAAADQSELQSMALLGIPTADCQTVHFQIQTTS